MDASFKNLPLELFDSVNYPNQNGILWLPPVSTHPFNRQIDWLSGMQISKLTYAKPKTWSKELKASISSLGLPLEETVPDLNDKTIVFSLPRGFKASLGLIIKDSDWSKPGLMYDDYLKASKSFGKDIIIQAFDIWGMPPGGEIQWIQV